MTTGPDGPRLPVQYLDPDIRAAAEFLASHAVLLLVGASILAFAALGTIVAAGRLVARHLPLLRVLLERAVQLALTWEPARRLASRTRVALPSAYLAVHLTLAFVACAAIIGFALITRDALAGGEIEAFDVALADALHETASPAWRRVFAVVSLLGSRDVLVAASVVVAIELLVRRRRVLATAWILGQGGGALLNLLLKGLFERPRPTYADPVLAASSWSFPSGHAMATFVFCGLGVYLLLRRVDSWSVRGAAVTVAFVWCLAMAFSRLYLGVHYASDVAAGLIAGTAWVAACVSGAEVALRGGLQPPITTNPS